MLSMRQSLARAWAGVDSTTTAAAKKAAARMTLSRRGAAMPPLLRRGSGGGLAPLSSARIGWRRRRLWSGRLSDRSTDLLPAIGTELGAGRQGRVALRTIDGGSQVGAALRAELAAEGDVLGAVGTAHLGLGARLHGLLHHARDHEAETGSRSEAHARSRGIPDTRSAAHAATSTARAAATSGYVADGLRGLELEVAVHPADRFHAGALVVVAGEVQHRVETLAQQIGQAADDDATEEVLDLTGGVDGPRAHQLQHQELRIHHLE